MNHPVVNSFLGAGVVVLTTVLAPLAVQAQSTNTTIQNGQINLNRTVQQGASNTNTTSQTGVININRTLQLGGNTANPTGAFGRFNPAGIESGRGFQGIRFNHGGDARGPASPDHSQRRGAGWRGHPQDENRQE